MSNRKTSKPKSRLRELSSEFLKLEKSLKLGGGRDKVDKLHKQGKLSVRERIALLLDKDEHSQEIGLLVAYDSYDGQAPSAAVVTTLGKEIGRAHV